MKKKLLITTLILSALFTLICSIPVNAEETDSLKYRVNADKETVSVTGPVSNAPSVILIPAYIDGMRVTSVDGFENFTTLTDITISEGIETIAGEAFMGCTNLKSIIIPNSVTTIGYSAFESCASLENIILSNSLTAINSDTFRNCTSLESITIPDSVEDIGSYPFAYCENLKDVTIGSGVKTLNYNALTLCNNLENLYINDLSAWTQLDFESEISGLNVPENIYVEGNLAKDIVIPDDVVTINKYVFHDWDCLESVEIGDNVEYIDKNAFSNCDKLRTVTLGNNVKSIGYQAFTLCPRLSSIVIPDSVTSIGEYTFSDCTSLRSAVIGEGITEIPNYTFEDCEKLANVTLGSNVKTIGDYSFESTFNLKKIAFPEGLESIGQYAFFASDLTTVTIPDSVKSLGTGVFNACKGLKDATLGNGLTTLPGDAFSYSENLETLTMGSKIQTIDYGAFDRTNLFTVYYDGTAEDVATITVDNLNSSNAKFINAVFYYNGESPKEEIVAESGESVNGDGIAITWSLSNQGTLTFSGNGRSPAFAYDFDGYAPWYNHASNVKAVVIEDGITSMENELFQHCTNLTRILVPESVKSISGYAFGWCNEYVSLYYAGSEEQFNAIEGIENIPKTATIHYNATEFPAPIIPTEAKVTRVDTEEDTQYSFNVEIEKVYENSFAYVAIYDDEYTLLELKKVPVEELETTIGVDKNENATGAKIFVWTNDLQPITWLSTVEL